MQLRAPKDFWSGIMFIAFSAVGMMTAAGYSLGSPGHMGPGYFPMLLGAALALIGMVLVFRSLFVFGAPIEPLQVAPLVIIAGAVVLFGLALERLGLVIALVIAILVSACASRETRSLEAVALAGALVLFSLGIFIYLLRLPLPVWPSL